MFREFISKILFLQNIIKTRTKVKQKFENHYIKKWVLVDFIRLNYSTAYNFNVRSILVEAKYCECLPNLTPVAIAV